MKALLLPLTFATTAIFADVAPPPSAFEQRSGQASVQTPTANDHLSETRAEAEFLQALKEGVQITQLGSMRCIFVFDDASAEAEPQVTQAFSDADFRVFTTAERVKGRVEPSQFHQMGMERYADLVVYTQLSTRAKPSLGPLKAEEATATVQVFNPMSEELLVSHSATVTGERHTDALKVHETAVAAAIRAVTKEVIAKTLEKAHKILVHEAQLKGVQDAKHLLEIMNYTAKLKGVYHVRQIRYDPASRLAIIEIIAAPQTEVFWRAYLEDLPKRTEWRIDVKKTKIVIHR